MNQKQLLGLKWEDVDTPYWESVTEIDYVKMVRADLPFMYKGIGIDPGRNFGITILSGTNASVIYGKMPKEDTIWHYGITAFHLTKKVLGMKNTNQTVAVEGPSFRAKYGQAGLESVRFGFVLGLIEKCGYSKEDIEVVPPATSRAQVLEHGHNRAGDFWPELNENAADSVALAFYAAGVRREGDAKRWPN